jgi:CheY-like chemotaxis protein
LRLLLIEDNDILIDGLTLALAEEGHQVIVSTEGRPAIGLIAHHRPDAVILDISLPDMDGVQVARFIRQDHPLLPIVFASGHDRDQPRLMGATTDNKTAILRKPYEIATLLETIHRLLLA